jgi:hypothetical protein
MLHKLAKFTDKTISKAELNEKTNELMSELGDAIGERDQRNANVKERIARYRQLSAQAGYGDRELPEYDDDKWLDEALKEEVRGLRDRSDFTLARWDPLSDVYSWADRRNYKKTDWYYFVEAVKDHQNAAWDILSASNLKGLELPQM